MRITNKMMTNRYLKNANYNLNNLQTINNQLTTGKEISRPSDNPYKVARSMKLNSDIKANNQYNTNITDTINWLDATDQALNQITNVMQRVRELMVSSGNAAYGSDERIAIADEVNERISELSQILNTNFDGKYLFGGTKTASTSTDVIKDSNGNNKIIFVDKNGKELITDGTDTYSNNILGMISSKLISEISQGVDIEYNVNAMEILSFKSADGTSIDLSDLLNEIATNLTSENELDNNKVVNENLEAMDKVIDNILKLRAEVGAKQNRMESAEENNESQNYSMTDILSRTEDIDFAEKMIEFSTAQTVYQAALQVSAQILPNSLLDYL